MTQQNNDVQAALDTVSNDVIAMVQNVLRTSDSSPLSFSRRTIEVLLERALAQQQPDARLALLECLNDAINLWDAQNPLNPDDINKWREVSKQSKANIEYIADAIVKAIGDILYLAHAYEKIGKFKGTIDDLTIVLNRLGLNEDERAEQKVGE